MQNDAPQTRRSRRYRLPRGLNLLILLLLSLLALGLLAALVITALAVFGLTPAA